MTRTFVVFNCFDGRILTGYVHTAGPINNDILFQMMHPSMDEMIRNLPTGLQEETEMPTAKITVHSFTIFEADGITVTTGEEIDFECDEIRTAEIQSSTQKE